MLNSVKYVKPCQTRCEKANKTYELSIDLEVGLTFPRKVQLPSDR